MSLTRFLPAWLHAIADYAVAAALITAAVVAGGSAKAVAAGIVIGTVVLAVSMLTRYPLGVVKVLSFRVHSAGDYLAAFLLVVSPFALRFNRSDTGLSVLHVAAGLAVLGVSLITNYQYSRLREPATLVPPPDEWLDLTAAEERPRVDAARVAPTTPRPTTAVRTHPLKAAGR